MGPNFIIYGVFIYFIGLLLSTVTSFSKRHFEKSQWFFVAINIWGFLVGILYLSLFSSQQLVLAQWPWLFGFAPTLNLLSGIFFTLISGVSALVGVYSVRYLFLYRQSYSPKLVQFLMTLFVFGMQGAVFANNAFTFLLFWEVMSITSFFLVMSERTEESVRAAFLYFAMTHLGASAILGGFLILNNGALLSNFSGIAAASQHLSPSLLALTFGLFFFGFGSKAGLAPFHVWLPEAHPEAPSNISALMSGLMLKVAVYGFIRVVFSFGIFPSWAGFVVISLGLLSAIVGVLFAVIERNMKRAFAFSSIENMGLIFTMLGVALYLLSQHLGGAVDAAAQVIIVFAIFHAVCHALFKTALFLSSGVALSRFHARSLEAMGGLAKIMPIFSFVFLCSTLASLPLPPLGTFYGEWGFIQSVIQLLHSSALGVNTLMMLIAILALMGIISGLAVFAMVKIFAISMLGKTRGQHVEKRAEKEDFLLIAPIAVLALGVLALGIFAQPLIAWLVRKKEMLTGGSMQTNTVSITNLSSVGLFFVLALCVLLALAAKKFNATKKLERTYHTWDCGQPTSASMEYTATAFSAPIRFFFLPLLGSRKFLRSEPVVQTNPWIRNYTFGLYLRPFWREKLYMPITKSLLAVAERIKKIQSGRIQYYLLFLLATLIITLIVVL